MTNSSPVTTNLLWCLVDAYGLPTNRFNSNKMITFHVIPVPSTNLVYYRRFPESESFDSRLFDQSGRTVPKTALGVANSQAVHPPNSFGAARRLQPHFLSAAYNLFRPDDMFQITNKGTYELEVRLRLWAQVTNTSGANFEPMAFNKRRFPGTNVLFGVVVSEPIRVEVVKE